MNKCAVCSNNRTLEAIGFQTTNDAEKNYFQEVNSNWVKHQLPGMQDIVTWTVYLLPQRPPYRHFSLMFGCQEKRYENSPGFTFEFTYTKARPSNHHYQVIPQTLFKKANDASKLGNVEGSAKEIMTHGMNCLAEFGDYNPRTHNCQHFCIKFSKELHIQEPWTSGFNSDILLASIAISLGVCGLLFLSAIK